MGAQKADKTQLSPREADVHALREDGLTLAQIASELSISHGTVRKYIRSINARATGLTKDTKEGN